jgi:hypothetical protein
MQGSVIAIFADDRLDDDPVTRQTLLDHYHLFAAPFAHSLIRCARQDSLNARKISREFLATRMLDGNFLECLKAMMEDAGDWKLETSVKDAILQFLDDMFPGMDERAHIAELCARFEAKNFDGLVVTLSDATSMKLFCDAYCLRAAKQKMERQTGAAAVAQPSGSA